jgi:hypothetical protein
MAESTFCPRCGRVQPEDAHFCANCGAPRTGGVPQVGRVLAGNARHFDVLESVGQEQTGNGWIDFIMFRRMIIPILIRVLFVVALVVCAIGFIVSLAQREFGTALLWLIGGPLAARLYGELFILLFVMNDTFSDIRRILADIRNLERASLSDG